MLTKLVDKILAGEISPVKRGKMTPRKKSDYFRGKKGKRKALAATDRRAAAKRGKFNHKSEFGYEGHSSWY